MMRILLDCDGVLADFGGGLLDILGGRPLVYDFISELPAALAADVRKRCNDPGFWRTLEPIEGAIEGVATLREFAEVYVVSSPWSTCVGWHYARLKWLEAAFGFGRESFVATPSKFLVFGDVLVEDRPETLVQWLEQNPGRGILFDQAYNREFATTTYHGLERAFDWAAVVDLCKWRRP